jgi:hypothetical protein
MVEMKHRTLLTAKAELVAKDCDEYKAIASKYGLEAHPQMDLLYVRSCLVSAGSKAGINANDDTFTRDEAWAARFSPVLKPANWQHNDRDILGVVYSVEARDLDGTILDLESDTPPDCEFEFWTEAVVYKLIQPERAGEIEARAQAGELFVSMEAWFDDYQYGLCDQETGRLKNVVARNADTSHLDHHLKANRGTGSYKGQRLVRVLSNITFGGYGFVDEPANKRSIISDVQSSMSGAASTRENEEIIVRIKELLDKCESVRTSEETVMNANASDQSRQLDGEGVEAAVEKVLDRTAKAQAKAAEELALQERATAAEAAQATAEEEAKAAEEAKIAKEAELVALQSQVDEFNATVDEVIQAEAGATGDTPAEIAAIDSTTDGAGAFAAKLAWLTKSRAALAARAERAEELEGQLAEAAKQVRANEVRGLFSEILSEPEVEAFVAHAATLDDEGYAAWRDQQEIVVLAVAAKPAFLKDKEEKGKDGKKEEKKKDAKASDGDENVGLFAALLENRRAEAEGLINHPGGEDLKSGVTTSAPGLKTPRHKIAGAAEGEDAEDVLESAQADDAPNLAGAADGGDSGEEDVEDGFRTLASEVTSVRKAVAKKAKASFDPVD